MCANLKQLAEKQTVSPPTIPYYIMRTKLGNNPRIRNLFTTFALGIRTNGCFFNRTEEVMKTQEIRIEDYNYS